MSTELKGTQAHAPIARVLLQAAHKSRRVTDPSSQPRWLRVWEERLAGPAGSPRPAANLA